ncbi:MAG: hypothetical protein Q9168_006854 [Polycauliona sp. 1 TL-2023]
MTPTSAPAGGFPLDRLAPELQHMVFAAVNVKDVPNLRLTCKSLGAVGLEYLVPEVELLFTQKSFDRLRKISEHPILSRHVKSLVYRFGVLQRFQDIKGWYISIPQGEYFEFYQLHPLGPAPEECPDDSEGENWSDWLRRVRPLYRLNKSLRKRFSDLWDQYSALSIDQKEFQDRASKDYLAVIIPKLPNLKKIALSKWEWDKSAAHQSLLVPPKGDPGINQLMLVLRGIDHNDLVITTLALEFNDREIYLTNQCTNLARKTLKSVTTLKLTMTIGRANQARDDGHVVAFLRTMPSLQVLDLNLWNYGQQDIDGPYSLKKVIGDLVWPELRSITVKGLETSQTDFTNFLSRHAGSLKVLKLGNCYLHEGTWPNVWQLVRDMLDLDSFANMGFLEYAPGGYVLGCDCRQKEEIVTKYILRATGTEEYTTKDFCRFHG